jgi:DNA-directed RNA polymerase specialized sigma24 family protein
VKSALRRALDRAAVARALARPPAEAEEVDPSHLPHFGADGARLGDPHALRLDWAALPHEYLLAPGALAVLGRALDELPARDRAALLVDTEGLEAGDVAAALGEPIRRFRRRLHLVRMILRERLTDYFAAATARH